MANKNSCWRQKPVIAYDSWSSNHFQDLPDNLKCAIVYSSIQDQWDLVSLIQQLCLYKCFWTIFERWNLKFLMNSSFASSDNYVCVKVAYNCRQHSIFTSIMSVLVAPKVLSVSLTQKCWALNFVEPLSLDKKGADLF